MKMNKKYALSIKQPWAELILNNKKNIELRSWKTNFRGEFYIHASKTVDKEACLKFGINPKTLTYGAIIGKGELLDIKEYYTFEQFERDKKNHQALFYGFARPMFGFIIDDVERQEPVYIKGKLKFFEVEL